MFFDDGSIHPKSYDLVLFTCALKHLAVFNVNTGMAIFLRQRPPELVFSVRAFR